ncbi:ankyrin repeat and LEM domain-containing protein 1 isoform 2-T2 [Guaruba guarouba]
MCAVGTERRQALWVTLCSSLEPPAAPLAPAPQCCWSLRTVGTPSAPQQMLRAPPVPPSGCWKVALGAGTLCPWRHCSPCGSTDASAASWHRGPRPCPPSTQEHLECEERDQDRAPSEHHSPGHEDTAPPRPLSDEGLCRQLRALGDEPGPITALTRQLYLRRLEELLGTHQNRPVGHSQELRAMLQSSLIPDCSLDELELRQEFDLPSWSRHWREGLVKSSFSYLLLDPRTTQNLLLRSHCLSPAKCFRTFVQAIFYMGKRTHMRPYCHVTEALGQHRAGTQKGCPKVRCILEIWASGHGVVSVHCFQSTVPAEAYTREGCLVEALGLQTITNQKKGLCYGTVAYWPAVRRRRLGVHMLHMATSIFLAEGERQLRPVDV